MQCAICPAEVKPHKFDLATETGDYKCPKCGTEWVMHYDPAGSSRINNRPYIDKKTTQHWLVTHEDGGTPAMKQTIQDNWSDACAQLGSMVRDVAEKVILGEYEVGVQAFSAGADHQHTLYNGLRTGHINVTMTFEPPAGGTLFNVEMYGDPQHGETKCIVGEPDAIIDNVSITWVPESPSKWPR